MKRDEDDIDVLAPERPVVRVRGVGRGQGVELVGAMAFEEVVVVRLREVGGFSGCVFEVDVVDVGFGDAGRRCRG